MVEFNAQEIMVRVVWIMMPHGVVCICFSMWNHIPKENDIRHHCTSVLNPQNVIAVK
jgi:hypothetical protein